MPHASPLIAGERLERALAAARLAGAALALGLGPLFPNIGGAYVVGLAAFLLVWTFVVGWLTRRAGSAAEHERVGRIGYVVDSAIVVYSMFVFAADPGWTTWVVGPLLIIGSAFRFGRWGGPASAVLLSVAYLAIVFFRQAAYGYPLELPRSAFHVSVYLLCAFLMTGALRELHALRAFREYQAFHDVLTGLPNRALLSDRLSQSLIDADAADRRVALLLLDLSDFKSVNDSFGHATGDTLLREVGARLRHEVRPKDTVARFGGDEYAIVLPDTDREGAIRASERLQKALERPFTVADQALDISASIGIVVAPEHGSDVETLISRADIAMYSAKSAAEGHVVYADSHEQHGAHRLALLSDLRRAIEENELVVHYQPLVSIRSGRVTGVEALARWQHPSRGLIAPMEFIPLAEKSDLIRALTRAVLNQSLRQLRAWQDAGTAVPVAVNLSVRNLLDPGFPQTVAELIAHWNVDPALLRFEITESVLMADPERALETLAALRELGLRLALDDFGTGYSSLSYLNRLPLDEVKIDRSFVSTMSTTDASATIVRATVDLGHGLGYQVVAEGVEDQRTWDRLAVLGCDTVQGYHIARPMPADEMTGWLRPRLFTVAPAITVATND